MTVENVRLVVTGQPRIDREMRVVEVSREEALRLAAIMAKDADAMKREVRRMLGGSGRL
jgi:hypothetical protein